MTRYHVSQPSLGPLEASLVQEVLASTQITQGPMVERFERALARYLKVPHVVACTSGTTALHLALHALGVGPGDEVLVPDLTYVATANAVRYCGATVRLVDVDETGCLDVEDALSKVIRGVTKAVIPVHLYGVAANIRKLLDELPSSVKVIEDAAEGFGGTYGDAMLGGLGDAGTFSFYGNKLITTGEGGAVACRDAKLAARLRSLRSMAKNPVLRYYHDELAFNYQMTDLQAALGVGQMSRVHDLVFQRHRVMAEYERRLRGVLYPLEAPGHVSAPWLFTALVPRGVCRSTLMGRLAARGIESRPTFVPLHRLPMYARGDLSFPRACDIGDRGISLPTYPQLTIDDADVICDAVIEELR